MGDYYYVIKTDETGKIVSQHGATHRNVLVLSDEIAPGDLDRGDTAFIIDKMDVAVCDGKGNWYARSEEIKSIAGGQPWSALF